LRNIFSIALVLAFLLSTPDFKMVFFSGKVLFVLKYIFFSAAGTLSTPNILMSHAHQKQSLREEQRMIEKKMPILKNIIDVVVVATVAVVAVAAVVEKVVVESAVDANLTIGQAHRRLRDS